VQRQPKTPPHEAADLPLTTQSGEGGSTTWLVQSINNCSFKLEIIAFNTPKYLRIRCSIAALQHCRIIEAFLAPMLHLSPFVKTCRACSQTRLASEPEMLQRYKSCACAAHQETR
jgi:hypothetical protein